MGCQTCQNAARCQICIPGFQLDATTGLCLCPNHKGYDIATNLCRNCDDPKCS